MKANDEDDGQITIFAGRQKYSLQNVPSLLKILESNTAWKTVYDHAPGSMKGLMTENVVDMFHAQAVTAVSRLDHAGFTPAQISLETGLMPAKIDVVLESIGKDVGRAARGPENEPLDPPPWAESPAPPPPPPPLPSCHLWEVKHSYYGETDYNEMDFATWEEFLESMGDADNDYNFLIRWDWYERDRDLDAVTYKGDDNERTGYMKLIYHAQRKGFTMSAIVRVCRNDEPKVRKYLEEKWVYMENMWAPISNGTSERVPERELAPRTPEQLVDNQYTELFFGDDHTANKQMVKEALGDFNPDNVSWVRHMFKVDYDHIFPSIFPPAGPFWYDRPGAPVGLFTVTAYLPEGVPVEKYWPQHSERVSIGPMARIIYEPSVDGGYYRTAFGRQPYSKPKWWPF